METFLGIDYPTWWFLIVGAVFSGYVILDGFDLGAGAWHLFLKEEKSRRIALNAVGPVWDGNEVWLVIGGGTLFAGFPVMYATLFSAMYIPFMLFLACLIFRAISIEFRGKEKMRWWRTMWDVSYSVSSILLAFLLGVVLGNILKGMPLDEHYEYTGNWLDFLNPYAFSVGITTLALFMVHGSIYLTMKTKGKLFYQTTRFVNSAIVFFIVAFAFTTFYTMIELPRLSERFAENPSLFIVPVLAFLSIANIPRLVTKRKYLGAFIFSALTMSFMLLTVAIQLFPVLLYSTDPDASHLTIYEAAASDKTLGIMLLMAAIGVPIVISYTVFVYKTFWGKVEIDEHSY